MPGIKLKIRQPGLHPRTARVWLGDQEISHGLTGLTVTFDCVEPTTAVLRLAVDDLDIDAATLAVLQAHVEKSDGDQPHDVPGSAPDPMGRS